MSEYYRTAYRQAVLIIRDSNRLQSPLPHTLEPRVDECSFEVQPTTVPGSPALFEFSLACVTFFNMHACIMFKYITQ